MKVVTALHGWFGYIIPPVIFVVGTAGAGKSSLVTSFQRMESVY